MTFGAPYHMPPPYVVLRRWGRAAVNEPGDYEWFMGHRPRWLLAWLPPVAVWEIMHLAHHDGLYRFRDRDEALAYIVRHRDMSRGDTVIEFVTVELTRPATGAGL